MLIIGLAGRARSGKDTCADYLVEHYGFVKYSLAGPIKAMLEAGLGLVQMDYTETAAKEALIPWLGASYRKCAQSLGTEWGRSNINQDLWLILAQRFVDMQAGLLAFDDTPHHNGVVISDVRFNNEAEWVRGLGGRVFHITRKSAAAVRDHPSEHGVKAQNEDALLINFGTKDELYAALEAATINTLQRQK